MDLATLRKRSTLKIGKASFGTGRGSQRWCPLQRRMSRVPADGEVRIIHSQGDVKRDTAGRPTLMFGTVQDITERKQAENKIRRLVDATYWVSSSGTSRFHRRGQRCVSPSVAI